MSERLTISEMFYSIQGEGHYAGFPAVFLRLAGCNLRCLGFSYINPETKQHLGCDTKLIWMKGKKYTYEQIYQQWIKEKWIDVLEAGAHLVLTGGEPLLQQDNLFNFISYLDRRLKRKVFLELETNATILLKKEFLFRLNQINVSPKLTTSGESRVKAYNRDVLVSLAHDACVFFKFVVSKPQDIDEILKDYVNLFHIPRNRVILMPEGATRDALLIKQPWLVELCKKHVFQFSPRLQINIWDQATGV